MTYNVHLFSALCIRYSDKVLAALLAVKPALCGHKFEVKVNDVLFLGHPLIVPKTRRSPTHARVTMTSFSVVFALQVCSMGRV